LLDLNTQTKEYEPIDKVFKRRLLYLKGIVNGRMEKKKKKSYTRQEIVELLTPQEVEETYDLDLLYSQLETKKKNLELTKEMIAEVTRERIKRHSYLDTMEVAKTLDEINKAMDRMRGYDLSASAERIVDLVNAFAKNSLTVNPLDIQTKKVEIARDVALKVTKGKRQNNDGIIDLLLEEAEEEEEEEKVSQNILIVAA
jgi:hypothetical protein